MTLNLLNFEVEVHLGIFTFGICATWRSTLCDFPDETAGFQDDGGLADEQWIDRVTLLTLQHRQISKDCYLLHDLENTC
ncbi:hypothetical protein P3L10_006558 [Capsicum annuum]